MSFLKVIDVCRDLLLNFPDAKYIADYLDNRISKSAQEKFNLGYFPDCKNISLLTNIIDKSILEQLNLIYYKSDNDNLSLKDEPHSPLENHNVIMPYKDLYGNIVGLVCRSNLSDKERGLIPKYRNTSFNKGKHLFGLYEAKHSIIENNIAYVVEGQFDCISAHDSKLKNTVALGSSTMTFEQFALLFRYTNNIILLLDNDEAGKKGTKKIIERYGKYANIKPGRIPDQFKDIDEYIKESNSNELIFDF
jgi:DNA primase catalytic core